MWISLAEAALGRVAFESAFLLELEKPDPQTKSFAPGLPFRDKKTQESKSPCL